MMILVAFGAIANGQGDRKPFDEKATRSLIEQLASPNSKPRIIDSGKGYSRPKYADGYDLEKQRKVYDAYKQLWLLSEDASSFPHLIEKLDDKRYSMCSEFNQFVYTHNVGSVCHDILSARIQPYQGFTNYEKRIRLPNFFGSLAGKEAVAKWWNENRHQSTLQVQLGVMDWMCKEMENDKDRYTDEDRDKFKKAQEELKESRKAILRDSVPTHYFVGELPIACAK